MNIILKWRYKTEQRTKKTERTASKRHPRAGVSSARLTAFAKPSGLSGEGRTAETRAPADHERRGD